MRNDIPSERDFLEDHGCLDAITAWENFGGLSLDEAFTKFCDNPVRYGEDFTFMGERAFAYYFDVLDRYVRVAIHEGDEDAFDDFWSICNSIYSHFDTPGNNRRVAARFRKRDKADAGRLRKRVTALCEHVIDQIPKLCIGSHRHSVVSSDELLNAWRGLQIKVETT